MGDGADPVGALVSALGEGWSVWKETPCGLRGEECWTVRKHDSVYCRAAEREGLLERFAGRPAAARTLFDHMYLDAFEVPEFLRCSSVEELRLKLEVCGA